MFSPKTNLNILNYLNRLKYFVEIKTKMKFKLVPR